MYYYKQYFILSEYDFALHFLREKSKDKSIFFIDKNVDILNNVNSDPNFLKFKRKIIIDNVVTPRDNYEKQYPINVLKEINEENFLKEFKSLSSEYKVGDYIWYENDRKGEVIKVNHYKKHKNYTIKVGKEILTVDSKFLKERENKNKSFENITPDPELQKLTTERLYLELKKFRPYIFKPSYNDGNYTVDSLRYLQIKKELATREHIKRKK